MSKYVEIMALVEGKTEQIFIEQILSPYLGYKNIGIRATQVSKSGMKGGDVRFSRVRNDIVKFLKQRPDVYVTTMVDYYGLKEWPGLIQASRETSPSQIANTLYAATQIETSTFLPNYQQANPRFIPYIAVHEFEALLFSDLMILSKHLGKSFSEIKNTLRQFKTVDEINNSVETAPSKRLNMWSPDGKFPKTTMGIAIANEIGIEKMRSSSPLFDSWISLLENL